MILSLQEDNTVFEITSKSHLAKNVFSSNYGFVFKIQSILNLVITLFKQNCQNVKISSKIFCHGAVQNKTVNRVVSRCILCAKRVEQQSSSPNEFWEELLLEPLPCDDRLYEIGLLLHQVCQVF